MTDRNESGRYSLAGFLYQIVGSGVEAFQLKYEDVAINSTVLELEQLGQDLISRSASDPDDIRLFQFKYSSTNAIINPSELRTILQTFLACVRDAQKAVAKCSYELRTNRELHPNIDAWFKAKSENNRGDLEDAIKATSQSGNVEALSDVCDIFGNLVFTRVTDDDLQSALRSHASKLGMLETEIPGGINRLIGFLAEKSSEPGERRVLATEIRSQFAGHPNAFELLSNQSIAIRRREIDRFQQDESGNSVNGAKSTIIIRSKVEDIVRALLTYPVVIVHGDGGTGKSIAVSDALMSCLEDRDQPPGFCLISRAAMTDCSTAISQIASWRNQSNHSDGTNFSSAFARLRCSYTNSPVLVICFDAIDEKQGEALSEPTLTFIRELIRLGIESRRQCGAPQVSVILTCRDRKEVENIPRNLNSIAPENDVQYILIEDYDDDEMMAAVQAFEGLDKEVVQRMADTFGTSNLRFTTSSGSTGEVSNDVIELLRHPVLWHVFAGLSGEKQRNCLAGNQQALNHLGHDYLKWFRKKAACRIANLSLGQCGEALSEAAKTFKDANDLGFLDANWLEPVADAIGTRLMAKLLYDEAISAGLILVLSQRERSWRWRHPWFCNFLVQNDGGIL